MILINVDKTKVMASNGIKCCILIQNEQLEQMVVDMFPYLEPYQVKQRAGDRGITAENMESHSTPISMKIRLKKVLVCPVATYGCES